MTRRAAKRRKRRKIHFKSERKERNAFSALQFGRTAVIGAAIEVHRVMGPGLIESIDERCLMHELKIARIAATQQRKGRIEHKGMVFDETLRCDVLAENCLLLELKCVQEILPIHQAQLPGYMKLMDIPLGLIFNFHAYKLTDGIARMILSGANR